MDVDHIPIKFIDGPPAEGDPEQEFNEFAGAMDSSGQSNSGWSNITPMTGSHIPGVDTGARGGQTTFMGSGGRMETVGSGGGSFGGSAPGGSTPYESMLRDHLLGQLPPDPSSSSVVCTGTPLDASSLEDAAATTLSLGGTALEGGALALGHAPVFGFTFAPTGVSAGYVNTLAAYGGEAPPWLANPSLEVNVGTGSTALRDANWIVDLGKYAPWLEGAGKFAGTTGLTIEGYEAVQSGDPSRYLHWGIDLGAYTGVAKIATTYSNPIGFTLGALWTITDFAASHTNYQGLHGWPAALARYGDTVIRLREADPGFMIDKW